MTRESLAFTLDQLKYSDWKIFEEFASEFMISEFPNLRSVGSPSGDRGRDSELFSPLDDPSVYLQYSVTQEWPEKIAKTAKQLKLEFPSASVFIYATNIGIGARGDDLKARVRRENGLFLDLRDREWFLERRNVTSLAQSACEFIIEKIATPILTSKRVIESKSVGLTDIEARAALVYLNLQWEDDSRDKGLTKLCFEALARSVLRETNSENRMSREEVRQGVRQILYTHPAGQVDLYTDAALKRLNKKYTRFWRKQDEFCLAHHEALRLRERLTKLESYDKEFQDSLREVTRAIAERLKKKLTLVQLESLTGRARRVLEKILVGKGELFVNSIKTGNLSFTVENIKDVVLQDLGTNPENTRIGEASVNIVIHSITELFSSPDESQQKYLRSLSDSYTLMAFLRETPDVQSAMAKMFSDGAVWLDTNVVLPLLAETLAEETARRFQHLLGAAREFGLKLRITSGVLEELERHMNRCLIYARSQASWEGDLPFLANMYAITGRPISGLGSWIELFRGEKRPADDIAEYLESEFGISLFDLEIESTPDDLRVAVFEAFFEAKERKGRADGVASDDPISLRRLVVHDVENYVGVIARRKQERTGPFGYSAWWLTLDKTAFGLGKLLQQQLGVAPPASPVMSPDFLVNYLAFGPRRGRLSKATEARLPLSIGLGVVDFIPAELLGLADTIRSQMKDLPEHVIRRRVRDELDAAKVRVGAVAYGGLSRVEDELIQSLSESSRPPTHRRRQK